MRRLVTPPGVLLCLLAVSAHAQTLTLKKWDAFTNQAALEWSVPDGATGSVIDNFFRFDNQNENLTSSWQNESIQGGYCVAVTTRHAGGVTDYPYGLSFGGKDYDNENFFLISADGSFKVGKFEGGQWSNYVDWTQSDALNAGMKATNRLVVDCHGTWRFFINGTQVYSMPSPGNFGGNAGIVVEQLQAVDFDQFLLAQYSASSDNEFTRKFSAIIRDFPNTFANSMGDSIPLGDTMGIFAHEWKVKDPVPGMKEQYFLDSGRGPEYFATLGSYGAYADAVEAYLKLKDHISITPMQCQMLDMGETAMDNVIEGTVWVTVDGLMEIRSPNARMTLSESIYPPGKDGRKEWEVGIVMVRRPEQ